MKFRFALSIIVFSSLSAVLFCQETLPTQVDRSQRDVHAQDFPNYMVANLAQVSTEADVIVVGKIQNYQTHFNKGEQGLETDYQLKVAQVLKPATLPNQQGMLIVKRVGGEMLVHGHKVTHTVAHTPMFDVGHEYLLFLRFDPTTSDYRLAHGPFGMYELKEGRVQTMEDLGQYNQRYNGMELAEFRKSVEDAISENKSDRETPK